MNFHERRRQQQNKSEKNVKLLPSLRSFIRTADKLLQQKMAAPTALRRQGFSMSANSAQQCTRLCGFGSAPRQRPFEGLVQTACGVQIGWQICLHLMVA